MPLQINPIGTYQFQALSQRKVSRNAPAEGSFPQISETSESSPESPSKVRADSPSNLAPSKVLQAYGVQPGSSVSGPEINPSVAPTQEVQTANDNSINSAAHSVTSEKSSIQTHTGVQLGGNIDFRI